MKTAHCHIPGTPVSPLPLCGHRAHLPTNTLTEHLADKSDPHNVRALVPAMRIGTGAPSVETGDKETDFYFDSEESTLYVLHDVGEGILRWESIARVNITQLTNKISELEDTKANKATTLAGYGITDAATKEEVEVKADKTKLEDEIERAQAAESQLTDKISELEDTKANKTTTLSGYGITDAATKEEVEVKADKTELEVEVNRAQAAEGQLTNKVNELGKVKADKATTLAGYGITDAATKEEVEAKADKTALEAEVARAQGAETQLTNKVNELDSDKAERITYENAGEINTSVTLKNNVIRRVEITDADINLDVILPENDKSYRNYCEMLLIVAENATSVNLITPPNTNVYSVADDALVPEVGMNHIIFSQVGECEWVASRTMLSNIVGGGTVVLEKSSSTTLMNNYELGDDNVVGDLAYKTGHSVEDDTAYGTYIENL